MTFKRMLANDSSKNKFLGVNNDPPTSGTVSPNIENNNNTNNHNRNHKHGNHNIRKRKRTTTTSTPIVMSSANISDNENISEHSNSHSNNRDHNNNNNNNNNNNHILATERNHSHSGAENVPMINNNHSNHHGDRADEPLSRGHSRIIHEGTTTSHAFWNLTKGFVGAASFALPWAVSKTGVIPASIGFVVLCALSALTFRWLLIASHFAGDNLTPTFPALAEIVFGNFFPIVRNRSSLQNAMMQSQSHAQSQSQSQSQSVSQAQAQAQAQAHLRRMDSYSVQQNSHRDHNNIDNNNDINNNIRVHRNGSELQFTRIDHHQHNDDDGDEQRQHHDQDQDHSHIEMDDELGEAPPQPQPPQRRIDHNHADASEDDIATEELIPVECKAAQHGHHSGLTVAEEKALLAREAREYRHAQANFVCGKIAKVIVYISMFLGMVGACGSYLLFISGVLFDWVSPYFAFLNHELTVVLLLPLPIVLALLRSYKFLAMTAKFGVAAVVLALAVTVYDGCTRIYSGVINMAEIYEHVVWFDMAGFPIFVGNAAFLFIIHVMVLSQEQSMRDRTQREISPQFTRASSLSLLLVTVVNGLFSTFAYMTFSDYPADDFDNIVNVLDEGPMQIATKICLCVDLLFTYALIMYPFTEAIDSELFHPQSLNTRGVMWKGNLIRVLIVIATALIAMFIPYFGYLTGLTGGSASVFVGLILPPLFVWRLAPERIYPFELYFLCPAVFVFGCVMFIWSPYLIISEMQSKM